MDTNKHEWERGFVLQENGMREKGKEWTDAKSDSLKLRRIGRG
jgi:hypothetical protein